MSERDALHGQRADLDVRETFRKKSEFAPNVTITDETFFGHGFQPLTLGVLQALWFLPHDATFDVPFLVKWFDRLGWKGANGKPLGANTVRRELGLLREAGHIQTRRLRGEGGKAVGIQYVVSQRRLDQPETGAWIPAPDDYRSSDHMSPLPTCGQSPHVGNEENPSSDHMSPMPTCGQSPHMANGAKPQVAPRGTNGSPPPHPPEEEDSSSPYPLTRTTGSLPSQQQLERAPEFSAEDLAGAADFLQRMRRWQAGLSTAKRCAPRLLRAMRTQGWPALASMDDVQRLALEAEILKNTGGATSWVKCLPGWVDDLCLYRPPAPAAAPAHTAPEIEAALRAACPACDQLGWVLDDDDDKPNRRCTHPGLAATTSQEQQ